MAEVDPMLAENIDYFQPLKNLVSPYMHAEQIERLEKAYLFAKEAHGSQKRSSGELYISHPVSVAMILAEMKMEESTLVAALLHDTVEDTAVSLEMIRQDFGDVVRELVDGLTKLGKVKFKSSQERLAENFRKMILAMAKDIRVILVKLADRLHNMRTIQNLPAEKRERISSETMDIYAPLANRLGIYGIKSELEDICLRELKPGVYSDLKSRVAFKKEHRQQFIDETVDILGRKLEENGLDHLKIYGRPKHFYSIYKKMVERQIDFDDIHDLFAFRVIVDDIRQCYEVLGIVHSIWRPMPGRFKDYIAMPKANLYQSLHTTVIRENGETAEIQIRTHEMHRVCEFGIAAHWAYKEKNISPKKLKEFSWLQQIVEWQDELSDPDEFLESVKIDLFDEEIFVFTPKGDVFSLPAGSSTLDFAFAVHTDIGLKTIGAKVNGIMVPLKKELSSGDVCEIITSTNQQPRKSWLDYVKTSKARNKIRSNLSKGSREIAKVAGKAMLENALHKQQKSNHFFDDSKELQKLTKAAKEAKLEDVYIAIGVGKIDAEDLLEKIYPKKSDVEASPEPSAAPPKRPRRSPSHSGVLVGEIDNVLIQFAKCCFPIPGDPIVGFVTKGRGVSIHRICCEKSKLLEPERKIAVSWDPKNEQKKMHKVHVQIITKEKQGVIAEITQVMSACGANISQANIGISRNNIGILEFDLLVFDLEHFDTVKKKLEKLASVISVNRK